MESIVHFESFLLAALMLNLTPGNDTMFILSKSMGQGQKAGIVSALGIGLGSIAHTLMAAFGLSLIIAESALWFNIIRYAGALYLMYIGGRMIWESNRLSIASNSLETGSTPLQIFRDAFLTNLLNPKVALFFIAFLPQFIDPTQKGSAVPFITLGLVFTTTGTLWCMTLAFFASAISSRLRAGNRTSQWISRMCGFTLLGLGLKVALSEK